MDTNKMRAEFEAAWRARYPAHGDIALKRSGLDPEDYCNTRVKDAWWAWQASRATSNELPILTDELLTAVYWDFDARRKGYPPYAAPAGQECGAFKAAIVSAIEALGVKCK